MLIVRDVFQAKYGMGDQLVALFHEMQRMTTVPGGFRVLVDASGPFFTVVTEMQFADFGGWEQALSAEMADPRFADWFQRMMQVVESGRREFYRDVTSR